VIRVTIQDGPTAREVTGRMAQLHDALDAFRGDVAAASEFVVELTFRGGAVDGRVRTTRPLAVARARK
jgi:hypothetical protein